VFGLNSVSNSIHWTFSVNLSLLLGCWVCGSIGILYACWVTSQRCFGDGGSGYLEEGFHLHREKPGSCASMMYKLWKFKCAMMDNNKICFSWWMCWQLFEKSWNEQTLLMQGETRVLMIKASAWCRWPLGLSKIVKWDSLDSNPVA